MTRLASRTLLVFIVVALLAVIGSFLVPLRVIAENSPAATFRFGGLERTYRVFRPATLAKSAPVPLVVMLHGGFGTGLQAEKAYHWDEAATRYGFVVLYPDGIRRAWNAGICCGAPERDNVDDVGFLSALIDQIAREQNVDRSRIYVTGISNGAMMAYRMACEAPLDIAAIGPVAGTLTVPCAQAKPTSVLAVHGLADAFVPFEGGVGKGFSRASRPSVPASLAHWREIDGCTMPAERSSGSVTESPATCPHGRAVELITIEGAGHQWPGSVPPPVFLQKLLGPSSDALDATVTLWQFFSAQRS
jgi:polyhydroxybutyrate depolymerase